MRAVALCASLLTLLTLGAPAFAGMGAVFPTYHPKPCKGGDCRGDDDHSGLPCQGLLCGFTSAKSLQRPVTASEAAEMQAKAATDAPSKATAAAVLSEVPAKSAPPSKHRAKRKSAKPDLAKTDPAKTGVSKTDIAKTEAASDTTPSAPAAK